MGRTCCRWCVPACGSLMECRWNVRRKRIGRTPPDHATRSTTIDNFSIADGWMCDGVVLRCESVLRGHLVQPRHRADRVDVVGVLLQDDDYVAKRRAAADMPFVFSLVAVIVTGPPSAFLVIRRLASTLATPRSLLVLLALAALDVASAGERRWGDDRSSDKGRSGRLTQRCREAILVTRRQQEQGNARSRKHAFQKTGTHLGPPRDNEGG